MKSIKPSMEPLHSKNRDSLQQLFSTLKSDTTDSDFTDMRQLVENRRKIEKNSTKRSYLRESSLKEKTRMISRNWTNALKAVAAACVLFTIVACTVPVEYEREAGTQILMEVSGDLDSILNEIRSSGAEIVSLDINPSDYPGSEHQIQIVALNPTKSVLNELSSLTGVQNFNSGSYCELVEGTMFNMVCENFLNIRIDISGLSDDEINARIAEELAASDFDGQIEISHGEDGEVSVEVEMSEENPQGGMITLMLEGEVECDGVEGELRIQGQESPLDLDPAELEGLTPEEIQALILSKMKSSGMWVEGMEVQTEILDGASENGADSGRVKIELKATKEIEK
jgi:hypothetical protein